MCGIAGIYYIRNKFKAINIQENIDSMTDALEHRGPDSRGVWIDANVGIALGHRRLAIRDLSSAGHQPMISSCGRYVIIYNGEVYSHEEIARNLKSCGISFRGSSDTEVILEACSKWGIEFTVKRLIGMFAFAVYDRKCKEIYLVRDRLGIKPLYYGFINGMLIFGSELKALRCVNSWRAKLNRNALSAFMRHNYIPAPHSIYENVFKLEAGRILKINAQGEFTNNKYWDLESITQNTFAETSRRSELEILHDLDNLLKDAVKRRMVADVPLGALLSGGVDSSLVTALMVEQSKQKINTFSIGFAEKEFNEAPYAAEIAKYLGTNHSELYVESRHALELVEQIPYWYDEPFADSSQIPTMLVSELTRKYVTVVLSGDGGDELFAGYTRYKVGLELWNKSNLVPLCFKKMLASLLLSQTETNLDTLAKMLPRRFHRPQMGNKLHKFANTIVHNDPDRMYLRMLSHWDDPDQLVIGGKEPKGVLWDSSLKQIIPDFLDRMQYLDTITYLPDDILTKVDRASMRVALEARVPLLDHRVVELSWAMPQNMKMRSDTAKWALREILYKRVPRKLIERPKMGFGVPLEQWLRGPLRDWVENLISEKRLREDGIFNISLVRDRWSAHLNGQNWSYPLWNVLTAQAWFDANRDIDI